jgi:hypothetical protein
VHSLITHAVIPQGHGVSRLSFPASQCVGKLTPIVSQCLKQTQALPPKGKENKRSKEKKQKLEVGATPSWEQQWSKCFSLEFAARYGNKIADTPKCITHPTGPNDVPLAARELLLRARDAEKR